MSALRLVSATGLPTALTGPWEIIDQEGPLAPARALYEGRGDDRGNGRGSGSGVWIPGDPAARRDPTAPVCPSTAPLPGSGLAAVPVVRGDRSIGALTVFTGDGGQPTPAHWEFLRAVVTWTEERMVQAPLPAGPCTRS